MDNKLDIGSKQGGILVFMIPIILLTLLIITLVAIDSVRLYRKKAFMQSQVNAAVSAAAQGSQSCGGLSATLNQIQQLALNAAQAQGFQGSLAELNLQTGLFDLDEGTQEYRFSSVSSLDQSNAVYARYRQTVPISHFLPTLLGTTEIEVTAAAQRELIATVTGSSGDLSLSGGLLGQILGALLGQPGLVLDSAMIDSLQDTQISLSELMVELGVDRLPDLLSMGADDLALGLSDLVGVSSSAGSLLNDMAGAQGVVGLKIQDIIAINSTIGLPSSAQISLSDLFISLVTQIASQQTAADNNTLDLILDISQLEIPLVSNVNQVQLSLYISSGSVIAIGPARKNAEGNWLTQFSSSDMRVALVVDTEITPINLLGLFEFEVSSLVIPLVLESGGFKVFLTSANCAVGADNKVSFGIDLERDLLSLTTGTMDNSGILSYAPLEATLGTVKLLALGTTAVDVLYLSADLGFSLGANQDTDYILPSMDLYCDTEAGCATAKYTESGFSANNISLNVSINQLSLLQGSLGPVALNVILAPVLSLVTDLLNDVVDSVMTAIIAPLLESLGISFNAVRIQIGDAHQSVSFPLENIVVN